MILAAVCALLCTAAKVCQIDPTSLMCSESVQDGVHRLTLQCYKSDLNIKFSAVNESQIKIYDEISIVDCSLERFKTNDADTLVENGIKRLTVYRGQVKTFYSFGPLSYSLTHLSLTKCSLNDEMVATLPKLHNLVSLSITNNRLETVPVQLKDLTKLETLDLSLNQITTLDASLLPESLIDLYAGANKISIVAFTANLYQLSSIDLSFNKLLNLKWLVKSTFPHRCREICLRDNNIKSITAENIDFLPSLRKLDLSLNQISNLDDLESVVPVWTDSIDLSENPLHCNCDIKFLTSSMWQRQSLPLCVEPKSYAGRSVEDLVAHVCQPEVAIAQQLQGSEPMMRSNKSMASMLGILGEK